MADTKIRINGLVHASSAELTDRYPIDNEDGITQSVSGQNIADMVATTEFDDLNTEDKTLKGAINELVAGGGGGGSSTFAGLTDVDIDTQTLANGQVPKYNSTTQKWENANESGGGGSTVTITPTLATGTKIADYSIDGTSGSLYAPSGGGSSNEFVITYSNGSYDKTAQEVYDAVLAGSYSFMLINGTTVSYSTRASKISSSKAQIIFDTVVTDTHEGSGRQFIIQTRLDIDIYDGISEYLSAFESINETIQSGTLTAGQTSVTISNCSGLSADSTIDVYTDTFGVNPTNVVANVSAHTITITFEAQASDLGVKVRYS